MQGPMSQPLPLGLSAWPPASSHLILCMQGTLAGVDPHGHSPVGPSDGHTVTGAAHIDVGLEYIQGHRVGGLALRNIIWALLQGEGGQPRGASAKEVPKLK